MAIIKIRRDTAANWTSANPTLALAEPGYETDTGKMKFGDGSTAWNSLTHFVPQPTIVGITGTMAQFDTAVSDGNIVFQGQALGTPSSGTLTNCTFPTLNQNTTGSAAKLTTPRNIQGVAFDGTAAIDIINGTGFVKASGTTISYDNSTYLTTASAASTYQPLDSDLTTIAGLTATTDNFLVSVASAWASRTPAQVKTTLALNNVENTALSTWAGTSSITTLGTIATGTWNATAIADGKIASALTGKSYNGVTLTTAGSATKYLNEQGNYVSITGGTGDVVGPASSVDANVVVFNGITGKLVKDSGISLSSKADLASPTFTGTPSLPTGTTGITQSINDNSTKLATTAYVDRADLLKADDILLNSAEQSQVVVSATNYYITNSNIDIDVTNLVAGKAYTWRVWLTKTAAGTGIFQLSIYRGTNATTADTQDVLQTLGTQTAVVDTMWVDVTVRVAAVGAGATDSYFWTMCAGHLATTATGFGLATGTTGLFSGTVSSVDLQAANTKLGIGFKATTGTPTIRVVQVQRIG